MINVFEVNETNKMIQQENLDVRTITMGISLLDCADSDIKKFNNKIYDKNMLWRGLLPYLNRKEQQRAIKFIKEIPQSIERIEKYIDEGLDIYSKIKVLNKKRDNCQIVISKKLKRIGELNNLMENVRVEL